MHLCGFSCAVQSISHGWLSSWYNSWSPLCGTLGGLFHALWQGYLLSVGPSQWIVGQTKQDWATSVTKPCRERPSTIGWLDNQFLSQCSAGPDGHTAKRLQALQVILFCAQICLRVMTRYLHEADDRHINLANSGTAYILEYLTIYVYGV